ncbi:MAG TPA: VWA domain-containing protein [Chloroflexia bacterium]|nr:VWA domain-containing protein [Chloroflexia bacterium]
MSGELNLRVALARPRVPVLPTAQLVYALLELRPNETTVSQALPLNLSLVLDRSGSMRGSKIERLREATSAVLDLLQPQDMLSVIGFNNRSRVLAASQPMTPAVRDQVRDEIGRLDADGGTNMAPAMEAGLLELWRRAAPAPGAPPIPMVSRMVLFTDGITEKEKRCLEQADAARQMGIPIVALGIGRDWNDKLMQSIAERSDGSADYVRRAEDIPQHFQRTVQQMQAVALTNARLDLRTSLGVTCRTVFRAHPLIARLGGAPAPDVRQFDLPLGELAQGHGQTLLLELVVPPRPAGAYRVAQVAVSYDAPAGNLVGEQARQEVLLEYTEDSHAAAMADPVVMNLVEKVTAFKLQSAALADLDAGNVPAATSKLQNAVTRLLNQGDVELAATVQQEIANLEKGRIMSPEGRKTIRFGSGQTVRLDKL